jgi:hypothetical protein
MKFLEWCFQQVLILNHGPLKQQRLTHLQSRVLPIDAQVKSSLEINYPKFTNYEELIVKKTSQAPFDFDKHMQFVTTNHESMSHSLS